MHLHCHTPINPNESLPPIVLLEEYYYILSIIIIMEECQLRRRRLPATGRREGGVCLR